MSLNDRYTMFRSSLAYDKAASAKQEKRARALFNTQTSHIMSFLRTFFGLSKKIILFVLVLAIAIPIRYGSTNHRYLMLRLLHSSLSLKHYLLTDSARPTLSADYRAFEDILRMKPIAEQDILADPIALVNNLRSSFTMGTIIPKPSQCQINNETFEHDGHPVHTYWIDYPTRKFQGKSDKLLLYFHGGGYIVGDIHSYSGIECHLSQLFNTSVLHVEYRLSPEHPLPAAVDDTVAVYRALLRNGVSSSQLIFMGDSAGGGLVLLTIQALVARHLPVPRGAIAISPWTDASESGDSYTRNAKADVMITADSVKWMASLLLSPDDSKLTLNDPRLSPLFGSFEGFPPIYVTVGTAEILEDDSREVIKKAQAAGVDITFEEGLHLMHVYPLFFPYFPEARTSLDNIHKWIQRIFEE